MFLIVNHRGIRLITRLRVLNHLCEHKFKHSFQHTLHPICSCGFDFESTSPYILDCPMYHDDRHTLLSTIKNILTTRRFDKSLFHF